MLCTDEELKMEEVLKERLIAESSPTSL